jgi:hypothetical protein
VAVSELVAFRLACELTTIPDCPRSDVIIEKLSRDLIRLCSDNAEAEHIVIEACDRWDRWRGTYGLIELLEAARRPELLPANQAIGYGPRPEPACQRCLDFGYRTSEDGRTAQWCTCAAGNETVARYPGLVSSLNRKGIKPLHEPPADRPPITQAEVDRLRSLYYLKRNIEAQKSRDE